MYTVVQRSVRKTDLRIYHNSAYRHDIVSVRGFHDDDGTRETDINRIDRPAYTY